MIVSSYNIFGEFRQYLEDNGIEVSRDDARAVYNFTFPSGEILWITEELLVAVDNPVEIFKYYF